MNTTVCDLGGRSKMFGDRLGKSLALLHDGYRSSYSCWSKIGHGHDESHWGRLICVLHSVHRLL